MPPKVPPIIVTGPEPWRGVESLPRVRELEEAGMKRSAVARIFGVTLETIRRAERTTRSDKEQGKKSDARELRKVLQEMRSRGVRGVVLPDEALSRESIYFGRV